MKNISKKFCIIILLLSFFPVIYSYCQSNISKEWVKQHYVKREVMIPMRDGIRLFTSIYEPKDHTKRHPILLYRTCYSCSPYGPGRWESLERPTWSCYTSDEYIIVFQDVRGKNMSEGVFEDLRPFIVDKKDSTQIDESSDTYDTVDWLINNTNSNERVGVFGISYPGFYATMAGLCGHPAIKAISPQAPVTDWYRGDDVHHNGALFILDMFPFSFWFEHVNKPSFWETYSINPSQTDPTDIIHTDAYNDYLKLGCVRKMTHLLGDSCKFWNDMLSHPDLDQWWEERNVAYYCQNIKPAVMVVGGLFDAEDCYGAFTTYRAIRSQSPQTELYLVEGPWSHGEWSRGAGGSLGDIWFGDDANMYYYINNIEYPFFSYYLNEKGDKPLSGARVFQTGENRWKYYPQGWIDTSHPTAFYLQYDGGLGKAEYSDLSTSYISDPFHPVPFIGEPTTNRPTTYMTSDQRFASSRPDVATFLTDRLESPVVLDGPVEAELEVKIDQSDCDFIVKLIDVFPDDFEYSNEIRQKTSIIEKNTIMAGYQMLVRWEVMRGKYRNCMELDSIAFNTQSSSEMNGYKFQTRKPEPFVPGTPTKVKIKMPDVAHTFLLGHRIMVQVQSSCFPLIDLNPQTFCNIYNCNPNKFRSCKVEILHSKEHPSRIWLPIAD